MVSTISPGLDPPVRSPRRRDGLVIVHLTAPAPYGGLEQVLCALATGQAATGHRVHVVAVLGPGDDVPAAWRHEFALAGVQLHTLVIKPRDYLGERRQVHELTVRLKADVIHSHGYRADVVAAPAAARAGAALISTVHGFTAAGWRGRLYERLQRRSLRRFDGIVAVSRALREDLQSSGVPPERVYVVQNAWTGEDGIAERAQARVELGIPGDVFLAGWVGRLSREKGCDVALGAFARLTDTPVQLSVIGDGPEQERLRTQAGRLANTDRIHWHGAIGGAGRLFRAFDVLVLSSRTEGTPIVLLEAMAYGVPVIATRVGGVPDVVSSDEALLVAPGDEQALADALKQVYADPAAARGRAERARSRLFARFSYDHWLSQYDELYYRVMERNGCVAT